MPDIGEPQYTRLPIAMSINLSYFLSFSVNRFRCRVDGLVGRSESPQASSHAQECQRRRLGDHGQGQRAVRVGYDVGNVVALCGRHPLCDRIAGPSKPKSIAMPESTSSVFERLNMSRPPAEHEKKAGARALLVTRPIWSNLSTDNLAGQKPSEPSSRCYLRRRRRTAKPPRPNRINVAGSGTTVSVSGPVS